MNKHRPLLYFSVASLLSAVPAYALPTVLKTEVINEVVGCTIEGCKKTEVDKVTTRTTYQETMTSERALPFPVGDGSEYAPPTVGAGFYAPCFADPNKSVSDCTVAPVEAFLNTPGGQVVTVSEFHTDVVNFVTKTDPIDCPPTDPTGPTVPEPSTVVLMLSGMGWLVWSGGVVRGKTSTKEN